MTGLHLFAQASSSFEGQATSLQRAATLLSLLLRLLLSLFFLRRGLFPERHAFTSFKLAPEKSLPVFLRIQLIEYIKFYRDLQQKTFKSSTRLRATCRLQGQYFGELLDPLFHRNLFGF